MSIEEIKDVRIGNKICLKFEVFGTEWISPFQCDITGLVDKIVIQQDELKNIDYEYHITPHNNKEKIVILLYWDKHYGFSRNLRVVVNKSLGIKNTYTLNNMESFEFRIIENKVVSYR